MLEFHVVGLDHRCHQIEMVCARARARVHLDALGHVVNTAKGKMSNWKSAVVAGHKRFVGFCPPPSEHSIGEIASDGWIW